MVLSIKSADSLVFFLISKVISGSFADLACFSFGGMIFPSSEKAKITPPEPG